MKERPILFIAPMVRAILKGRKMQTRRVIKPQPVSQGVMSFGEAWKWNEDGKGWFSGVTADQIANPNYGLIKSLPCPYGQLGDRLWVKETSFIWGRWRKDGLTSKGRQRWRFKSETPHTVIFDASHPQVATRSTPRETCMYWKRPSIFMPRWASRITLEITDVRVQRLQEISEEDAKAEGTTPIYPEFMYPDEPLSEYHYRRGFQKLWDSINGKKYPWTENCWVWAISFKRVEVQP
jgi:hypothetical protein